jgi:poly(hydroxyalkanoate) depolymerase family esterase
MTGTAGAARPSMLRSIILLAALLAARPADAALTAVTGFGTNPGGLAMYEYVPAGLPAGRPIVFVLHGCTQTAAAMESAGWNQLADQFKFTVIYPEQQTANNPVRCFNWAGEYGDTANLVRGQGENASIIQMVDKAIAMHAGDSSRVFIVGFSAGAGFTSVMLATYPERFAGGAIMSGLPYRCATSVSGAYSCQSPGVSKTSAQWGDLVRGSHAGPYPRVQIWHGASDTTVVPANEAELVKQWANAHGIDETADETETIGTATRTAFKAANGNIMVEAYKITGMSHATAVGTDPSGACTATAAQYFENKGICSTRRAAAFFGLLGTGGGGGTGTPDTLAPSVAIQTPSSGDTVTGTLTVVVAAGDETAMGGVTLQVDGTAVGPTDTEAPYQFTWDATAAGGGAHTLLAIARDAAGNSSTATAMVTVPGAGSGSGSGSGMGSGMDDDAADGTQELPGCSLDAGSGGRGFGALALVVGLALARRRRR